MNRRDLFKRAGRLGAGLGLAAVVGKGVVERKPTSVPYGFDDYEGDDFAAQPGELPFYGYSQPWTFTTTDNTSGEFYYNFDSNATAGTPGAVPSRTFTPIGDGKTLEVWVDHDGEWQQTVWFPPHERQGSAL